MGSMWMESSSCVGEPARFLPSHCGVLPALIAIVAARPQLSSSTYPLVRRGARSVTVRYEIEFSINFGTAQNAMAATLEEKPIDLQTARFTFSNVRVKRGDRPWQPAPEGARRSIEGPFVSAQNLFGIEQESAVAAQSIAIEGDELGSLATTLPLEAVVPLGGAVTVVGYEARRLTLRGKLDYLILNEGRAFDVEARFDPDSGRPVSFRLSTAKEARITATRPEIVLTFRAAPVG